MKPSASSTSAEPDADETARLPCFATPAPAAAATSAAAVEMLIVACPSPPVPGGVDEVGPLRRRRGRPRPRIASAKPAISSGVSPFSRSATRKPPIWAWRRLAGHDLVHHRARLSAVEVAPVEQLCERLLDHRAQEVPAEVGADGREHATRGGTGRRRRAARGGGRPSPRRRPPSPRLRARRAPCVAASEW